MAGWGTNDEVVTEDSGTWGAGDEEVTPSKRELPAGVKPSEAGAGRGGQGGASASDLSLGDAKPRTSVLKDIRANTEARNVRLGLAQPGQKSLPADVDESEAGGGRGYVNPPTLDGSTSPRPLTMRQLGRDLKGGVADTMGLARATGAFGGAADYRATADMLADFDAIDAGQTPTATASKVLRLDGPPSGMETSAVARNYQNGTPEQRATLRANAVKALERDKNFVDDSVKAVKAYSEEKEKLSGHMPEFTDIETARDFGRWLARTGVSGAPTMAAAMLGAAAGPLGFAVTSGGMAIGDLTQARIEAASAATDPKRFTSADRAAEANDARAQKLVEKIAQSTGTTAALAIPYAALDLLGPVGKALHGVPDEVKRQTIREILKHGAKSLPSQLIEEFANEGGQEVVNVLGDILAGERPGNISAADAKRIFNAGMAGVAMAPGGHAANVAHEVYAAARDQGFHVKMPLTTDTPDQQRSKTIGIFSAMAAKYGVDPDAVKRATEAAGQMPADDVGPFLRRLTDAYQKRGLVAKPVDDFAAATLTAGPAEDPKAIVKREKAAQKIDADVQKEEEDLSGLSEPAKVASKPKEAPSDVQVRKTERPEQEILPSVSRGVHAGVEKDASTGRRGNQEGEGASLQPDASGAGPSDSAVVRGVRRDQGGAASPELRSPASDSVAVPEASPSAARGASASRTDTDAVGDPEATPIDIAATQAATHPSNDRAEPTQPQKQAENYKVGHDNVTIPGERLSIENGAGSTRRGVSPEGKEWSTEMQDHYGRILGTVGMDSTPEKPQHVDFFAKAGTPEGHTGPVFIVDQVDPKTGAPDEHKIMLGYDSIADAKRAYLAHYEKGWKGLGAITETTLDDFKAWVHSDATSKPFAPSKVDAGQPAAGKVQSTTPAPASSSLPRVIARVGPAPAQAHPLELRPNKDGSATVWHDGHEILNFESGEPVQIPAGTDDAGALDIVKASGAFGRRAKYFSPKESGPEIPSDASHKEKPARASTPGTAVSDAFLERKRAEKEASNAEAKPEVSAAPAPTAAAVKPAENAPPSPRKPRSLTDQQAFAKDYAHFEGRDLRVTVQLSDTGGEGTLTMPSAKAMRALDKRLQALNELKLCIGRAK